jgi:hypothetical protein
VHRIVAVALHDQHSSLPDVAIVDHPCSCRGQPVEIFLDYSAASRRPDAADLASLS